MPFAIVFSFYFLTGNEAALQNILRYLLLAHCLDIFLLAGKYLHYIPHGVTSSRRVGFATPVPLFFLRMLLLLWNTSHIPQTQVAFQAVCPSWKKQNQIILSQYIHLSLQRDKATITGKKASWFLSKYYSLFIFSLSGFPEPFPSLSTRLRAGLEEAFAPLELLTLPSAFSLAGLEPPL